MQIGQIWFQLITKNANLIKNKKIFDQLEPILTNLHVICCCHAIFELKTNKNFKI